MSHYRNAETLSFEPGVGTVLTITYNPCPDENAARELELWGDNTESLYNHRQWVIKNAKKHAEKGEYRHHRLIAGLERYYYFVAQHYCKHNGGSVRYTFPKPLRRWMAEKDAEELRREILNWS